MKSHQAISETINKLRTAFEEGTSVDSGLWEKVVEALDEGVNSGWLSQAEGDDLRERLSELEDEMKSLENF
ncbi:MAG: hypothetical protein M0Z37_06590 [Nitrospiraceae bacterium]|jgi:hypothetical protein|nr:hypothetical protein [Nitrospiraceae bacterium]